jgi:hypothetical protein
MAEDLNGGGNYATNIYIDELFSTNLYQADLTAPTQYVHAGFFEVLDLTSVEPERIYFFVTDVAATDHSYTLDLWVYSGDTTNPVEEVGYYQNLSIIHHDLFDWDPPASYNPSNVWHVNDTTGWTIGDTAAVYNQAYTDVPATDFAFGVVESIPNTTQLVFQTTIATNGLSALPDTMSRVPMLGNITKLKAGGGAFNFHAAYSYGTVQTNGTVYWTVKIVH